MHSSFMYSHKKLQTSVHQWVKKKKNKKQCICLSNEILTKEKSNMNKSQKCGLNAPTPIGVGALEST